MFKIKRKEQEEEQIVKKHLKILNNDKNFYWNRHKEETENLK